MSPQDNIVVFSGSVSLPVAGRRCWQGATCHQTSDTDYGESLIEMKETTGTVLSIPSPSPTLHPAGVK